MNHAPSPSPPLSPEPGPSAHHEPPSPAASTAELANGDDQSNEQSKSAIEKTQKLAFLDHLIRNFDIVFFCQLSILYYMDCSLLAFLLRALPHWYLYTPKPPPLYPLTTTHPNNGPYIGPLLITNLICILFHLIYAPPAASEAARGYLHGGMMIDFVGQASPVGRWRLLGGDVLCVGLQVVMMGLTVERMVVCGVRGAATGGWVEGEVEVEGPGGSGRPAQDLDAEERGMTRDGEGFEMQDLGRGVGRTGGEEDAERDELLDVGEREGGGHPLDKFYAGDHLLVRLHLRTLLRSEYARASRMGAAGAVADAGRGSEIGRFFPTRLVGVNWSGLEGREGGA